ncbi:U3 snoRNP protein [Marasmius crinis-equi]|uniref:U3 snoRNP protein n=1 Tax=Marasmius crinis-equi TaxID=585013 RepID=A0ABR3G1U8_9AGAR
MERVQFQQEQMLDELKDLVEKKIFTVKETKQIIKQRTAFENTLVRRVAKKSDFLRYAQYEMNLELLRRKRLARLNLPPAPATVSDYALVRRQFQIFERALKRFKSDVGLWIQYIQVAQKEGARSLVGRITARALQLHPNTPSLYILAATHELNHLSPSTARSLLQRGIRLNPESIEMWKEYVKMELGFIESLRRRWDVLGIDETQTRNDKGKEKEKEQMFDLEVVDEDGDLPMAPTTDEDTVPVVSEGQEGAAARKEIMSGVIVKAAISSAVQAMPKIELFEALNELITGYPSPPELRESLILHLDELLCSSLPDHPRGIQLICGRMVSSGMAGEQLINGIKAANAKFLSRASSSKKEETLQAYSHFVWEQYHMVPDDALKLYLVTSLQSLIHAQKKSPSLLSTHIKLLTVAVQRGALDGEKVLNTAKKYTSKVPEAACVWLARLEGVLKLRGREGTEEVWAEARRSVPVSHEDAPTVWTWGLAFLPQEHKRKVHEELLRESMRDSALQDVHEALLLSYVSSMSAPETDPTGVEPRLGNAASRTETWKDGVRHMQRTCHPTRKVWQKAFMLSKQGAVGEAVLREIYESWRRVDEIDATVEWAQYLSEKGEGKEAMQVVLRSKNSTVEERWAQLMEEKA